MKYLLFVLIFVAVYVPVRWLIRKAMKRRATK